MIFNKTLNPWVCKKCSRQNNEVDYECTNKKCNNNIDENKKC